MTSEGRMRNTDFSIARILSDDRSSPKTRAEDLPEERMKNVDDEREPRASEVDEERRGGRRRCEERVDCVVVPSEPMTDVFPVVGDATQIPMRADLTWLQYTRYRPPKLPRRSYVERRTRRRTDDRPRIPFSSSQLQMLEDRYRRSAYLSRNDVVEMSAMLRLPQSKIKIWFQNRRARQRRESLNSTMVAR